MSDLLLDTHTFIWLVEDSPKLPNSLKTLCDRAKRVYLSIASLWEIDIKVSLEKLNLQRPYAEIAPQLDAAGIELLEITFGDTARVRALPFHHRDPFDRLLIAQAIERNLVLVSRDRTFDLYAIERLWAERG